MLLEIENELLTGLFYVNHYPFPMNYFSIFMFEKKRKKEKITKIYKINQFSH